MNNRNIRQAQIERIVKEHGKRKRWHRVVSALSAVAVFCTTYAMILPAITWERSLQCAVPEHRHEASCYETVTVPAETQMVCGMTEHLHGAECYENVLVCGEEEHESHTHGDECFNEAGEVTCGLAETEGHSHSDACYVSSLMCSCEEHIHSDACFEVVGEEYTDTVLVCQLAEHEHTASCFDAPPAEDDGYCCRQIEHTHSEEQYCYFADGSLRCTIPEHVHTPACLSSPEADAENETELSSASADESDGQTPVSTEEAHVHSEECYERKLVCPLEEGENHSHAEDCYEMSLVCTLETVPGQMEEHEEKAAGSHTSHTEDEGYYCGQIGHTHSEEQNCYSEDGTLECALPEHQHTLACKSNPEADVESEEYWRSTFADVSLTGNWADDVIAVAKTQIGYTESTQNYEVQEDGTAMLGYTRYGDWYGNAYGDWCAMFCSFCLYYANVDTGLMPIAQSCRSWVESLAECARYHDVNSGYEPGYGDLVFFRIGEGSEADHVGFVYAVNGDGITTIEGNWNNCVCTVERRFADGTILGYGELPENPNLADNIYLEETNLAERTVESEPASDGAIAVVTGNLPETAVVEIEAVTLSVEQLNEFFGAEKASAMSGYVAYDITIFVNGEEWQPDETVSVTIRQPDIQVSENQTLEMAHVDSVTNEVSIVSSELDENGDIRLSTEGFSLFIAYTVDFHYGDLIFSIEGESEVLLSEIFAQLGIDLQAADAVSVVFSDSSLIEVIPIYAEDGVTVVDWKLTSLAPFQTEELLSVVFKNGGNLEIVVTDSQNHVWCFHQGETEPYAMYDTLYDAITYRGSKTVNKQLASYDVIELHGDTLETKAIVLPDWENRITNVSVISEKDSSGKLIPHTVKAADNFFDSVLVSNIDTGDNTLTVKGIIFDGNNVVQNLIDHFYEYASGNPNMVFEDCTFEHAIMNGISGECDLLTSGAYVFKNCVFAENGMSGVSSSSNGAYTFENCIFRNNGSDGASIICASFDGCVFENNGGYGVRVGGGYSIVLHGCAFHGNKSGALFSSLPLSKDYCRELVLNNYYGFEYGHFISGEFDVDADQYFDINTDTLIKDGAITYTNAKIPVKISNTRVLKDDILASKGTGNMQVQASDLSNFTLISDNYSLVYAADGNNSTGSAVKDVLELDAKKPPVWVYRVGDSEPYGEYDTLYAAVNNTASAGGKTGLQDNDVIEFHGDTTETNSTSISKNNIEICSASGEHYTAYYSNYDYVAVGYKDAVYINNVSGINIHDITFVGYKRSNTHSGCVFSISNGTVTFGANCIIKDHDAYELEKKSTITVLSGNVIVDGATIKDNTAAHGAAIYNYQGTVTINDTPDDGAVTTIENNIGTLGCGGGICNHDGTLIVNGGLFKDNQGQFGGGIYNRQKLYVYGGTFTGNSESAISSTDSSTLVIGNADGTGPYIYENTAKYGAAVQIQNWGSGNATAVINGGTFTGNHASVNGGALTTRGMNQNLHLTINGGTFTENTAQTSGGVIDIVPGTVVTVNGGTFCQNIALSAEDCYGETKAGKAGAFLNAGELYINGGTIKENTVVDLEDEITAGGAVYNEGNLHVNGGTITDNSANYGNGIYQNGNMYLSGAPAFGAVQDIYLPYNDGDVRVITKNGEITSDSLIPVILGTNKFDMVRYRNMLVSGTQDVVETDNSKFSVLNSAQLRELGLCVSYTAVDDDTGKPVLELDEGGPFYVVSLERDFPTLQEAVNAADTTDTILIHPCADYGVTEYGASYATNDTSKIGQYGGEVYITGKNLTIKSENGKDTAPLKDFEIIFVGTAASNSYTVEDVKFIGQSMLDFDNQPETGTSSANYQFGNITVTNCYANVSTTTQRTINGHPLGDYSGNSFIVFPQQGGGTTQRLTVAGNTIVTNNATRCIYGGARPLSVQIYNNTFGSPSGRYSDNAVVFERFPAGITSNIEMYNNVCYTGATNCGIFYLNSDNAVQGNKVNITVHDNEVFGSTYVDMTDRTRILTKDNKLKPIGTVAAGIALGTTVTYRNYVNGYCDNEVNKGSNGVVYDTQCGHTYDDHIKDVPAGKTKVEDIYQLGNADEFDGTTHSDPIIELGNKRYCDRCDELTTPTDWTLSVAKQVVGITTDEEFAFTATIEDGSFSESENYTINTDGSVNFSLKHNESIELIASNGATVTIRETTAEGFYVKFTDASTAYIHNGASDSFEITGDRSITVVNTAGAVLPSTGSIGVYPIYALGVLLIAGSVMCGYILRRKRERRAE